MKKASSGSCIKKNTKPVIYNKKNHSNFPTVQQELPNSHKFPRELPTFPKFPIEIPDFLAKGKQPRIT